MKKVKYLMFSLFICIIGVLQVGAIQFTVLKEGDTIYLDANNLPTSKFYIYRWKENSTVSSGWPGDEMINIPNTNIWYYEVTDTDEANGYNMVIYSNNDSKQTIDLSYLGNGLIYQVTGDDQETGNYTGVWRVYDSTELENALTIAESKNENDYTYSTYTNLKEKMELASKILKEEYTNDYYLVRSASETDYTLYTSDYEECLKALNEAIDALVERKNLVSSNAEGGSVNASYIEKSDDEVSITVIPDTGYYLSELKVTNITGYNQDDNTPILGTDVKNYDLNDTNTYLYTLSDSDIYIEPVFKKNVYKLNVSVGLNGVVYDNGNIAASEIEVEYGTNYNFEIKANEGYAIDKVLVDGNEYSVNNDILTIENISKDLDVEVTFKVKVCSVIIDGINYELSYGSSYSDLVALLNGSKEGYTFKGLTDENGNEIAEDYVVKDDINLSASYEKITSDSSNSTTNNPLTLDNITGYVVVLIIASIAFITILVILKKTKKSLS